MEKVTESEINWRTKQKRYWREKEDNKGTGLKESNYTK